MIDGIAEALDRRRTAPIGDRGLIVSVASWVLLVATMFTLLTRLAMKLALSRKPYKLGCDDLFIILAGLFSVGQTVAVSIEAVHALGQHRTSLDDTQFRIFQKAEYTSCILYIANMGFARISVCVLIKQILPGAMQKFTAMGFAIFSLLWCISAMLVAAFPCHLHRPWDGMKNKCFDVAAFVNYVGISNIVVEVLLIALPLWIWNLRLTAGKRISVSLVFASRFSIVACVITQLVFFNKILSSTDMTYDYWRTVLCIQVAQNLSVITACLPCLHPFMLGVLSGATKPDYIDFDCKQALRFREYLKEKHMHSSRSSASTTPIRETHYVAPLATYGLDRSSAHFHSAHFNRFPTTYTEPPSTQEVVFNRSVEIPHSRPISDTVQKELPPLPKTLSQVGVLPLGDWETDSSDTESGRSSQNSRRRDSDYVFQREKVISVPEATQLYPEEYAKKCPPLPEK